MSPIKDTGSWFSHLVSESGTPFYYAYRNRCGFDFEREVMEKIVNHPFIIS